MVGVVAPPATSSVPGAWQVRMPGRGRKCKLEKLRQDPVQFHTRFLGTYYRSNPGVHSLVQVVGAAQLAWPSGTPTDTESGAASSCLLGELRSPGHWFRDRAESTASRRKPQECPQVGQVPIPDPTCLGPTVLPAPPQLYLALGSVLGLLDP